MPQSVRYSHFAGQNPVDESSIKLLMVVTAVVNVLFFKFIYFCVHWVACRISQTKD